MFDHLDERFASNNETRRHVLSVRVDSPRLREDTHDATVVHGREDVASTLLHQTRPIWKLKVEAAPHVCSPGPES